MAADDDDFIFIVFVVFVTFTFDCGDRGLACDTAFGFELPLGFAGLDIDSQQDAAVGADVDDPVVVDGRRVDQCLGGERPFFLAGRHIDRVQVFVFRAEYTTPSTMIGDDSTAPPVL